MAITLEDFSNSQTDYVAMHNRNNTVLEVAVSALQASVASSTVAANQNLPYLLQAMFGNDVTPNVIDENDCVCSIVGLTVEMTAGYCYLPGLGAVCYNTATTAVDLTALGDGTYYITMTINGVPTYNDTGTDGIYSVIKTGSSLGTLTKLATNAFGNEAPLSVAHGGTSLITITNHGVMVGAGTSAVNPIVSSSSGQMFRGAGSGSAPTWSTTTWPNTTTAGSLMACTTTNIVSGLASATYGVLVTNGTGAGIPSILAGPGATGRVLTSNAAAAPSWSTATFPGTAGATGTFLRSDGTNWVASVLTLPNAAAVSTILYASSADVIGALATANSGVLVTSGAGVPSIATDIPTAVTIGSAYVYRVGGTDVSVADGGTGLSTLTAFALYAGNGTSAPTALAVGATGTVLIGNTGADPSWSASPTVTSLLASSNDSGAIGASGTAFSDLFLASGSVINFNAGDVTVTHSANTLAFAGAASGYTFNDGGVYVGVSPNTAYTMSISGSADSAAVGSLQCNNPNDGSSAASLVVVASGTSAPASGFLGAFHNGYSTVLFKDRLVLSTNSDATGLVLNATGSNPVIFSVNESEVSRISSGGAILVGVTSLTNIGANVAINGGVLAIKETTTPTADTDWGKVYTKSDNLLYFQDGAGTEHTVAFV